MIGLPDEANGDAFPSMSPREWRFSNRLFLNGHAMWKHGAGGLDKIIRRLGSAHVNWLLNLDLRVTMWWRPPRGDCALIAFITGRSTVSSFFQGEGDEESTRAAL
jgi:hypothetical protein